MPYIFLIQNFLSPIGSKLLKVAILVGSEPVWTCPLDKMKSKMSYFKHNTTNAKGENGLLL